MGGKQALLVMPIRLVGGDRSLVGGEQALLVMPIRLVGDDRLLVGGEQALLSCAADIIILCIS